MSTRMTDTVADRLLAVAVAVAELEAAQAMRSLDAGIRDLHEAAQGRVFVSRDYRSGGYVDGEEIAATGINIAIGTDSSAEHRMGGSIRPPVSVKVEITGGHGGWNSREIASGPVLSTVLADAMAAIKAMPMSSSPV
jgi:hypothetical protein